MNRNTDWELVNDASPPQRPGFRDLLRALLSSPWRWKFIGGVLAAAVATAVVAIVAGVALFALAAVATITVGVLKVRRWINGERRTTAIRPR